MANESTRVEDVTAHIEAVIGTFGEENYNKLTAVCLKDISISLAMLVDNSGS